MLASLKRRLAPSDPERPPDPDAAGWPQFADHVARYAFAMEYAKGKRALDAGTGPGYGASLLHAGGASRVVGVDIDSGSIAAAQKRYGGRGIEFLVDDCETLGHITGPFDLICSFENIEHLPHPERFLDAAARLLAPGGTLIVSSPERARTPPHVNGRPTNPHHFHEWYAAEFLELLGRRFGQCDHRIQVKTFSCDRRQQATGALVRHLRRSNPILWLVGVGTVLLHKRYYWEPILELGTPAPADYPIVSQAAAPLLGTGYSNVVMCTQPRP